MRTARTIPLRKLLSLRHQPSQCRPVAQADTQAQSPIYLPRYLSVNERWQLVGVGREIMDTQSVLLMLLFTSWGVITGVLIVLVIHRATLSSREDDQIFIDAAEQHYYRAQQEIIARMSLLTRPIVALSVASVLLLMMTVGVWVYQGFKSF
jgi:hypothetical protein